MKTDMFTFKQKKKKRKKKDIMKWSFSRKLITILNVAASKLD